MLISEKTTGSIYLFIFSASREAYPIVRQLEKKSEKSGSESSKMREKQILGP